MAQSCLKCLKYIMCAVNFLFFIFGVVMLSFGGYMISLQTTSLLPSMKFVTAGNLLLTTGIIVTCVSFLGFIGALKENRCFLLTFFILLLILMLVELAVACLLLLNEEKIGQELKKELTSGLAAKKQGNSSSGTLDSDWALIHSMFECCGVHNYTDWNVMPRSCCKDVACADYYRVGCLHAAKGWFEHNFLKTGVAVIVLCIIEVLGMCISMTLFCHISSSGLGYKL